MSLQIPVVAIEAGMDTSYKGKRRVLPCTNLPKLVHGSTSLFLTVAQLKICTVKCIGNSLIHNLQGKCALFLYVFSIQ